MKRLSGRSGALGAYSNSSKTKGGSEGGRERGIIWRQSSDKMILSSRLDAEPNLEDWRALAEATCSRALIVNAKRCSERAKIDNSLTTVEQKLCER